MDFNFTQEQQQYAEALRRWAARDYTFETRRKIVHSEQGVSNPAWRTLAELGMTALPVPEAQGGFDGDPVDLYVVMQELGRALVVEPYLATVWGSWFLRRAGQAALLEQLASGSLKLACAFGEPGTRHDMREVSTTARREGDVHALHGTKSVVVHGAQADILIVSAQLDGEIALFAVGREDRSVQLTDYRTIDGQRAADIRFEGASGTLLAQGWDVLDEGLDVGVALLCAEAMGALQALFDATLEYTKTRTQFGVPIGKFQALQHRMADMSIHLRQARSMALLAAVRATSPDALERRRCVSAAKYRVGLAIRFIGQQAIQLHGGMGMTDELPAAHHFKRLSMIEQTLGDADHHLQRFIDSSPSYWTEHDR